MKVGKAVGSSQASPTLRATFGLQGLGSRMVGLESGTMPRLPKEVAKQLVIFGREGTCLVEALQACLQSSQMWWLQHMHGCRSLAGPSRQAYHFKRPHRSSAADIAHA